MLNPSFIKSLIWCIKVCHTNDIKAIIKMNLKYGFVKKACNLR